MAAPTLAEEDALIATLAATGRVAVTVLGTTTQGRPVRLLRVGTPPPPVTQRAVLLMVGAQHGNEVDGRTALLNLAEDLSTTADQSTLDFLTEHGLLLIPTANPDGVALLTRANGDNLDVNRDHIALESAEARAVATVLRDARPALVVDLHIGSTAESAQLLHPTTPGVDPVIVDRSKAVVAAIGTHFDGLGLSAGVWPGSQHERILRNISGLRNCAGVIAEVDASGTTEADRIDISRAVADAALAHVMQHAATMLAEQTAADTRQATATGPIDLRATVLDPAPVAYQLSATQVQATAFHRDVFAITGSSQISLAQRSRLIIAFLADPDAEFAVVAATRVFAPAQSGGDTGIPPVASATIRQQVTWLGCHLATGKVITELADLSGQVSRVIGRYTSANLTLPIPPGGPGHLPMRLVEQATDPARAMIVAVVNDVPTWAGIVLPRVGGSQATLSLGCVSVEGYLQHRFVRTHTWVQQDEASVIAAGLLADAGPIPGVGQGIALVVDAPPTGQLRDRAYLASDHKSVYEALTELMAVEDGPEWTIDPDWADDTHTAIRLIARVRNRLGVVSTNPHAVFESTSESDSTYEYGEDRSGDRYANYVVAYSSGEGEDQPVSDPAVDTEALDAGVPIWERHFQPSSSIRFTSTLDAHARAELARVRHGARTWQITARWDRYPRYGVDWQLGDDIAWLLTGHRHPDGATGAGRAVGFALDIPAGTIRPILQETA